ncbi:hypothetical protein GCM10010168_64880 [Actinoplanes ianthinogenes]|uniref:Uncharacterized protein n=1 Tax=Actinoplanes ianthinogenes TaxID=122358 RepID=A0ABM7LS68_9ACTN|nr:hypothetical protein [Actinoplanes ianthinogenes]BCJ42134.1 hypothetical protein Aiant_27910 [Actinoplanes ianthinogenes]GGR37482.1 hypothetical protein GCM10010168_64880 [Actinoplanes ianthinogenes]
MSEVVVEVSFTPLPEDDDFALDLLTDELAEDLSDLGEIHRPEADTGPDAKGLGEVALSTLSVVAGADPGYAQALVDLVVGFLGRNRGRRAHLKVGDIELTIDQPTKAQASEMIDIVRNAIERSR